MSRVWIDRRFERLARGLARRTSRRGFLARVAGGVLGAAALPLLPVDRAGAQEEEPRPAAPDVEGPAGDPQSCEYWRYCGFDGFLCSCCGGSHTACPPGSEMAPITWIGTCRNPADGRDYIISYNDCCGKGFCARCFCNRNEGDRPVYVTPRSNDINWCIGSASSAYHCTTAIVVGVASDS